MSFAQKYLELMTSCNEELGNLDKQQLEECFDNLSEKTIKCFSTMYKTALFVISWTRFYTLPFNFLSLNNHVCYSSYK